MYRRRIVGALRAARNRIRRVWPLRGSSRLAWVLLALCLAASASAALVVRATAKRDAVRAFDIDATKVESNVAISLKRVDDVAVALADTLAIEQRAMTNSELARWYAGVSTGGRYPGLLGFTYIRYVPAWRLSRVAAGDRVFPSGRRAGYCLLALSASPGLRGVAVSKLVPAGATVDLCAIPGGEVLPASRDSGQLSAVVITLAPHGRVLNISVPVYSGREAPSDDCRAPGADHGMGARAVLPRQRPRGRCPSQRRLRAEHLPPQRDRRAAGQNRLWPALAGRRYRASASGRSAPTHLHGERRRAVDPDRLRTRRNGRGSRPTVRAWECSRSAR